MSLRRNFGRSDLRRYDQERTIQSSAPSMAFISRRKFYTRVQSNETLNIIMLLEDASKTADLEYEHFVGLALSCIEADLCKCILILRHFRNLQDVRTFAPLKDRKFSFDNLLDFIIFNKFWLDVANICQTSWHL